MVAIFNIDLVLILAFLVLNLGLGLWYGKGVKSMKDFALGGRNFSTGALTAALVANWIGGSTLHFGLYEIYVVSILALCSTGQVFNLLQLNAARALSIIIGIVGLYIALSYKTMLDILLFGASFYTSIVCIPLLFTIVRFRSTSLILSWMIAGALTTYFWNKYFNAVFPIWDIVPSAIANITVMMTSHYKLRAPDGWVGQKDRGPLDVIKEQGKQHNDSIVNFCRNLPKHFTWKNILSYCNNDTYLGKYYYITYIVFSISSLFLVGGSISISNGCAGQKFEQIIHIITTLLCSLISMIALVSITKQQRCDI